MRLREQIALIEAGLPRLRAVQLAQRGQLHVANGKSEVLAALQFLARVPPLQSVLAPVIKNPVFTVPGDD